MAAVPLMSSKLKDIKIAPAANGLMSRSCAEAMLETVAMFASCSTGCWSVCVCVSFYGNRNRYH